jgi:hypothetical protein
VTSSEGRILELVDAFFAAFSRDRVASLVDELAPEVSLTLGLADPVCGPDQVSEALRLPRADFDLSWTTVTNDVTVTDGRTTHVYLTAHHLHAMEARGTLYSVSYGGKYDFAVDPSAGRINAITFLPEYLSGNTHWLRSHWGIQMPEPNQKGSVIPTEPLRTAAVRGQLSMVETVYCALWALDVADADLLRICTARDVLISRQTVDLDVINVRGHADGGGRLQSWFSHYHPMQYSILVDDSEVSADGAIGRVMGRHLNPGNRGNLHLASGSKHSLFCDEDINLILVRTNGHWQLSEARTHRHERIATVGPSVLRLSSLGR